MAERVGYVLKVFPRLSQTFVLNEIAAHERAGVEVEIFSVKQAAESPLHDAWKQLRSPVTALSAAADLPPDDELAARLADLVQERGIGHLHAHFGNIATTVARQAARLAGITYSFTAHARDIFDAKVKPDDLRAKLVDAAAVITVSRFNVRYLAETYGVVPVLLYNGMPLQELPYSAPSDREPLVLGVGRLIEKKGFSDLVEASRMLRERGISHRCAIIGDGPEDAALAAQIAAAGLQTQVTLTGALAPGEVREFMQRAAVLAVPCVVAQNGDRDGLPTVLLEAMALGTPCVGTDVTGIPEVVEHERTGLMVHEHDVTALADACGTLLLEPARRETLARAARTLIEQSFDAGRNAARLRTVFADAGAPVAGRTAPQRIVFRVYNRRGMGHLMRGLNIAREIRAAAPDSEILVYTRTAAPFAMPDAHVRALVAADPQVMAGFPHDILRFAPQVVVDDTVVPAGVEVERRVLPARRVFIMRKCAEAEQRAVFASPSLLHMDLIVVPHTPEEFGYDIPAALRERTRFVGPIVRRPDPAVQPALRAKYRLQPGDFLLLSTPGGGGFQADCAAFFALAAAVHARLLPLVPALRHVVVRGPNATVPMQPAGARMTVVDSEPEMASLIGLAGAVISAGGYNSVSEIRLAQRPAFFIPGRRHYDNQDERVRELERAGLAIVFAEEPRDEVATAIAACCAAPARLAAMHAAYTRDRFVPGNRDAAQAILDWTRH